MKILLVVAIALSFLDLREASPCTIMLSNFVEREIEFSDVNTDNAVTKEEYLSGFTKTDVNSDDRVTVEEYTDARDPFSKAYAPSSFKMLDSDESGFVTESEMEAAFKNQDADDDGSVSIPELQEYYNNLCP